MFFLRVVKGAQKHHARDERILINGKEYRTNEGGVINCNFDAGKHEVMVGGRIHQINVAEGDTAIVEID